jgi:hypothetical protein
MRVNKEYNKSEVEDGIGYNLSTDRLRLQSWKEAKRRQQKKDECNL